MNKITAGILTGTMALSLNSCKREPLHLLEKNSNKIIERVDSFAKSKLNKPDTTGLTCYKIDTVKITDKQLDKPEKFIKKTLSNRAWRCVPKKEVGSTVGFGPTVRPHINMNGNFKFGPGIGFHIEEDIRPLYPYKTLKMIVENKVFATPENKEFYVPVKYYGKLDSIFSKKPAK